MRRGIILAALLAGLLLPGLALAGGGGNVKLSRSISTVGRGVVPVYFQVLQHGTHPVEADQMTVKVTAPDGRSETMTVQPDPAFGADYVYRADVNFSQTGDWRLELVAEQSYLHFPRAATVVTVKPSGVTLPDQLHIYERGAGPTGTATRVTRPVPDPGGTTPGVVLAGTSVVGVAALAGAVLLWQRRRAHT